MNKIITIILLIISLVPISAQTRIGLTGGINFSNIESGNSISPEFRSINTLSAGAVINVSLSDKLSFLLEPQYMERGADLNIPGLFAPGLQIRLTYIEVPILLKFTTGKELKPYLIAGPTIAFNLSSEFGIDMFGFEIMADVSEITRDVNPGLCIGGGLGYETDAITLFVEVKYNYFLNNFIKDDNFHANIGGFSFSSSFDEELKLRSSGFQLTCGFLLPISE